MRRVLVLAALIGLFAVPSSAQACRCVEPNPGQILARSDAAFIGILKSVRIIDESQPNSGAIYRYRVHRDFGVDLGRYVRVVSPSSTCAIPRGRKRVRAMGLERVDGYWTANLCSMVDPNDLREAAAGSSGSRPGDGGCAGGSSAA